MVIKTYISLWGEERTLTVHPDRTFWKRIRELKGKTAMSSRCFPIVIEKEDEKYKSINWKVQNTAQVRVI